MNERTVIITGGNAGLGYETARKIAQTDPSFHIVLACRSLSRADAASATLQRETGNANITSMQLDLASLGSVRAFAAQFAHAALPPLNAIVCNAGISAAGVPGSPTTQDGIEMIFGVNHLGHFLLTNLLLPRMQADGRIVFVTSDLHNPPRFFPAGVRYDSGEAVAHRNSGMAQYCVSKLCNLYCTYEMAARIDSMNDRAITVNAFNPGAMSDTGFTRPAGNVVARAVVGVIGGIMGALIGKQSTAAESGAALAGLVTRPDLAQTTGTYFDRTATAESSALSHDVNNARELWDASSRMTHLDPAETIFA